MTFSHIDSKKSLLEQLINQLTLETINDLSIIPFASPIVSFGSYKNSTVATMGLNPSDREFVDISGNELIGKDRRFHTLNSLEINEWKEVTSKHVSEIEGLCDNYFSNNPYKVWFRDMENLISATGFSLYKNNACHLDLIPYATSLKWGQLTIENKTSLLKLSRISLHHIMFNSNIELIILNGQSVVDGFAKVANVEFQVEAMSDWDLPQKNNRHVRGYAYNAKINNSNLSELNREILVLGFNHNLQSSFGVTSEVKSSIRHWIAKSFEKENI